MDREIMGQLAATRATLQSAIELMDAEQIRTLLDHKSGTLADLTKLWSSRGELSGFQEGFLNELKRITFRLTHRLDLMESGESVTVPPGTNDLHLYCIQCNMPTPIIRLEDAVCPTCGSDKFLEAI